MYILLQFKKKRKIFFYNLLSSFQGSILWYLVFHNAGIRIPTGQIFLCACGIYWAFGFPDGLMVKNLTAMQEMQA